MNQGIFRNVYADMDAGNRDIFLLLKYYIKMVEFVNSCDELDDFVKEILVSVLNKVLKRGFIGNSLNLNNIKLICSEEFSVFKNIQLEELILFILKSHAANTENWIILKEDELMVDYYIFEEKYIKDLYNNSNNKNSSSYWENYKKGSELYLQGLSFGQIKAYMESMGIKTVTGNDHWDTTTIQKMLKNEKYKGDAMLQKTYTEDFMTGKKARNVGQRN